MAIHDPSALLNSAGVSDGRSLLEATDLTGFEHEMAVNVFGVARMCQAFAPIIAANGGGAIANMLSTGFLVSWPTTGTYGATKAAANSLTEVLRYEMRDKGVEVFGIFAGRVDTDMTSDFDIEKTSPSEIARNTLIGIEAGDDNVDADERSKLNRTLLKNDPEGLRADVWLRAAEFRANHPLT